jgi:SWIM zinc finger
VTITVSTADPRSCKALALLESADTWLKIRRKSDGVKFYVIPGSAGHVYWTNCGECSCPDFQHRGAECKHITAVKLYWAQVQAERPARRSHPPADAEPLPCSGCHNYHRTDAERLQAHPDARRDLAPGGAAWLAVQRAAGGWPR